MLNYAQLRLLSLVVGACAARPGALNLSPRRFELLQIPHQEIILPLNYRLLLDLIFLFRSCCCLSNSVDARLSSFELSKRMHA